MSTTLLVASDVHGRIASLYALAARWQRDFRQPVAAILVSGDLGVWPDDHRLDSATRRALRTTPDELGFRAFEPLTACERGIERSPDIQRHLDEARRALAEAFKSVRAPLYFVGGNHEDFTYLAACAARLPDGANPVLVERSARVLWLRDGVRHTIATPDAALSVAALGGISAEECGRSSSRYHPGACIDEERAVELVCDDGARCDVLLTHDSARDFVHEGYGASVVGDVVAALGPTLHLSGHYHSERSPAEYRGAARTLGVHVNTLIPEKDGFLRPNSLGVITLNGQGRVSFEFAPRAWLRRIPARHWKVP